MQDEIIRRIAVYILAVFILPKIYDTGIKGHVWCSITPKKLRGTKEVSRSCLY